VHAEGCFLGAAQTALAVEEVLGNRKGG
jgi:hypothetical protein